MPASLKEAAGETVFPEHCVRFLILCRQLDLSVFTHMPLFCLKRPCTFVQGQPVLQAVTVPTGDSPVQAKEGKPYPALEGLSVYNSASAAGLGAYTSCLLSPSLIKNVTMQGFSFPVREKLVKLQENVIPGIFLRRLLGSRVHGAIHDFWQQQNHHKILKAPVTYELTFIRYAVIASPGVLMSLLLEVSQIL